MAADTSSGPEQAPEVAEQTDVQASSTTAPKEPPEGAATEASETEDPMGGTGGVSAGGAG